MIPALFVAQAVKSYSKAHLFDRIIFAEPPEVTDVQRQWMKDRGIRLCEDMDLSRMRGVGKYEARLSPATLMKLLLAEHLAGRYDKILYLDCDLTIHDDVASIFSLDPAPFALAAVPSGRILVDLTEKQRKDFEDHCESLGMSRPYRFFNTGVLYIDVERWNRENLGQRALDFIRKNPDLCSLPDEHALNAILDGNIAELSPLWNKRPAPRWLKEKIDISHPVIIHYAGYEKPWQRFYYGRKLFQDLEAYKLYKDFVKHSPWPGWLNEQWKWRDLYMNIRGEVGRILRKMKLKSPLAEPSDKQQRAYVEAVHRYYDEGVFTDTEQGIVIRENGKLHLDKNSKMSVK